MARRKGRTPKQTLTQSHPELLLDWHPDNELTPDDVSKGSEKNILWRCHVCQHEWNTMVFNRIRTVCPFCTSKSVHSDGRNSLAVLYPELASELHPSNEVNARELATKNKKKLLWECNVCSHQWRATPADRTRVYGGACPVCSGQQVHSDGRNSLAILFPRVAEEWHPNNAKPPRDYRPGSNEKVLWVCRECENEWEAEIGKRTRENTGCPECWESRRGTRRGTLQECRPDLAREWHPSNEDEPSEVAVSSNKSYTWICSVCDDTWDTSPNARDNSGTGCPACVNKKIHNDGRNSLARTHPDLAAQWSEKNELNPEEVLMGKMKAWWKCTECEFEWETHIDSRRNRQGCPACSGRELHHDKRNSLATINPLLSLEWHPENEIAPDEITSNNSEIVRWICSTCQHDWEARVANRNRGSKCPACIGYVVHKDGRNSLEKMYPEIAKEWHVDNPKSPAEYTWGANYSAKWECKTCSHNWFALISSRTCGWMTGCPVCAPSGFDPSKPAYYYCFTIEKEGLFWCFKGGITNSLIRRETEIRTSLDKLELGFELKLIESINFQIGADANKLERRLLRIREIRFETEHRFSGSTELFSTNPILWARENEFV